MRLRDWRQQQGWTLVRTAQVIGMSGTNIARALQRIEIGEALADADVVAAIGRLTGGHVTASDLSATRLEWLRRSGRDRFPEAEAAE